jgi:DNA polymerase-3 subunit delta
MAGRQTRRLEGVGAVILKRRPDIERFLATPGDARAALIWGPDIGQVRERADSLSAAATPHADDPFDVALLGESDLNDGGVRLEEELMAYSMMGGRRLVRLRLSGERGEGEETAASALTRHAAGEFNPDAFFLVEAGNLKTTSGLRKAAEKADRCGAIACYADEAGDLVRLTREALASDKVGLTPEAMDLFVSRLPQERGVARQEIERLALYLGPGTNAVASAEDLAAFVGVEPESSLADAAIDAFGGRLVSTHTGLRRAAQEGETGPAAIRALSVHLGRLRRAVIMHAAGVSLAQATKDLRVFWKVEREFQRQARGWSLAELDRLPEALMAADQACKRAGAPDRLISEHLALSIAGRARRLGL